MSISGIVNAISASVVDALKVAGYPALTDEKIQIGRQHQFEQSAPPRIVFTPLESTWGPRMPSSPSNVQSPQQYTNDQRAELLQRAILTEWIRFEVRCWGAAGTGNVDDDIDVTKALYQQVIMSTHLLAVGSYDVIKSRGVWTQASIKNTQFSVDGQEFVFTLAIATPVLDKLLLFAPTGVVSQTTVTEQLPNGQSEIGAVIQ